jgi:hypothetical protein
MNLAVAVTLTQREMKMSNLRKMSLMTLADLQNKVLRRADNIQKLTELEQINLENECTEFLKNLVDYVNKHYLRSYVLRLEMEE